MSFSIILILLIGLSFICKRNKFVFIFLLLCNILIMGLNYDNPDYINYESAFNIAEPLEQLSIFRMLDIGTTFILSSAKELGVKNYTDFRIIYTAILFIIFGYTILRNCKYPNSMLGIYLAFYLVLDEIQMRNFSSFVIFLPFFIYYTKNQNVKGLIIYLIGVLLAFTLHFSAIFYLLFALSIFKRKKMQIILLACSIVFLTLAESYFTDIAMLTHIENYDRPSILGVIFSCMLLLMNYMFIKYCVEQSTKIDIGKEEFVFVSKELAAVTRYNFLLMFLIPVIFINATVLRIWRFTSIFNIIFLLNIVYYLHMSKKPNWLLLYIVVYAAILCLWSNNEGVWQSFFYNPLFEY